MSFLLSLSGLYPVASLTGVIVSRSEPGSRLDRSGPVVFRPASNGHVGRAQSSLAGPEFRLPVLLEASRDAFQVPNQRVVTGQQTARDEDQRLSGQNDHK